MAKTKSDDVVIIPFRADLPIGTRFKFKGGRAVYEIAGADCVDGLSCDGCAFNKRKRQRECFSIFCRPLNRDDGRAVFVKKVR